VKELWLNAAEAKQCRWPVRKGR